MEMDNHEIGFIFAGGDLTPAFAETVLRQFAREALFVIAVDAGLEICENQKIQPDLILGDFDGVDQNLLARYEKRGIGCLERYNPVKDASDLELAAEALWKRGIRTGIVLGALGGRADHGFANVRLCYYAARKGLDLSLLDPQNRIRCYAGEGPQRIFIRRERQWGHYIAFFPIGGTVEEVTLSGFRYPMTDQILTEQDAPTLTVSNELVQAEGVVSFRPVNGSGLLIMETRDRNA